MKKILLVAVSAVLLAAGCQKTEIVNPVGEPTMNFSAKMGKLTKAGTTSSDGVAKLQDQEFKVWAFTTWTDPINGIEPGMVHKGMENLDVYYNEARGWHTEQEYYWPGKGLNLNFFALSSNEKELQVNFNKTVDDTTINTAGDSTATRVMNVVSYTVDHTNPIDDLMVADFVHQNQSKKDVTLKFRHALSKVEFLFKTSQQDSLLVVNTNTEGVSDTTKTPNPEYREVKIDSIKVAGINTTAALTVTETVSDDEAAASYVCEWSGLATEQSFVTKTTDTAGFVIDPIPASMVEPAAKTYATWLVLPQPIAKTDEAPNADNLTVEIFYWMGANKQTTSFEISTSSLKTWEPNQYIRYIVDITPALIKFTPEVEDWELADPVNNGN